MILKTPNLILRPWEESDAKCLYHFAKNLLKLFFLKGKLMLL